MPCRCSKIPKPWNTLLVIASAATEGLLLGGLLKPLSGNRRHVFYLAAARPAAFFAAQYFLTPSLIFLMAAGLIFLLAGVVPSLFETVALPGP